MDNLPILQEIKTLILDNRKHLLRSFCDLSSLYQKSKEVLKAIDDDYDEVYENLREVYSKIIQTIQKLTIPDDYYVEHLTSVADFDTRLVFSIYYNSTSMVNHHEGRNALYTFVVNVDNKTFEFFDSYSNYDLIKDGEIDKIDEYYFNFPQI